MGKTQEPIEKTALPEGTSARQTLAVRGLLYCANVLRFYGRLLWVTPLIAIACLIIAMSHSSLPLPEWAVRSLSERANQELTQRGAALHFGGARLALGQGGSKLIVQLEDSRLIGRGGVQIDLSQAHVGLSLGSLMMGKAQLKSLSLAQFNLGLQRDEEGLTRIDFGAQAAQVALPQTMPELMAQISHLMNRSELKDFQAFNVSDFTLNLQDAKTGRTARLSRGQMALEKQGETLDLTIEGQLGSSGQAGLTLRRGQEGALEGELVVDGLESQAVAAFVADEHLLSSLGSTLDGALQYGVNAQGALERLSGQLDLGQGRLPLAQPLSFDHAVAEFDYDPTARRLAFSRLGISSESGHLRMSGQALLPETMQSDAPVVLQLAIANLAIDPEGAWGEPIFIQEGLFEGRVRLAPFALDVGQFVLRKGGEQITLSGKASLEGERLKGQLAIASDDLDVQNLLTVWPEHILQKTRKWVSENVPQGRLTNVSVAMRSPTKAREKIVLGASFGIEDARIRFLKDMPLAQDLYGAGSLHEGRLSFRIDRGVLPAKQDTADLQGMIALQGTRFTIENMFAQPAQAQLELQISGQIEDALVALDHPPFRVLERINRSADLASGLLKARGTVEFPLRPQLTLEDIPFEITGQMTEFRSTTLVAGRDLTARSLMLEVSRDAGVVIRGPLALEGVPGEAFFSQALLPRADGAQNLPELSGHLRLSERDLTALDIRLPNDMVTGEGRGFFDVSFRAKGQAPVLQVSSDLSGIGLKVPALGWQLARGQKGRLRYEMPLTQERQVGDLIVEGAGGLMQGTLFVNAGSWERLEIARLRLDRWLDVAASVSPQSQERLRITLKGGTLDLRRLPEVSSQEGAEQNAFAPMTVALDRITVTETLSLRDVTGEITPQARGLLGRLQTRVNGKSRATVDLAPSDTGTAVRVTAPRAGEILADAGIFGTAGGGAFDLRLFPEGPKMHYRGTVNIEGLRLREAPVMAALLSAVSVVGLLEQLDGEGLAFSDAEAAFLLRPDAIYLEQASATGPSLALTADGLIGLPNAELSLQGVISPLYAINGLFGGLLARRKEGLVGLSYRLDGPSQSPQVRVNPLSAFTPGIFREIFRRAPPKPDE